MRRNQQETTIGLHRAALLLATGALLFACSAAVSAQSDPERPGDSVEPLGVAVPGAVEEPQAAESASAPEPPAAGPSEPAPGESPTSPASTASERPSSEEPADGGQQAPRPGRKPRSGGLSGLLRKLNLFQGVTLSGSNVFTFQNHRVEGSRSAFETQRWDTGRTVRQSSVHVEGPLWKEILFQADISDSGWGPGYSRWLVGFVGNDTALLYGDVDMRLGGNEFVGFQKSTRGWQLDQRLPGGGFMRGFYAREKGLVRNQTFIGNDTPGPYFLTYTPVIEGSEVVKVNEEYLKFGTDYRLDYDSGQLWFEPVEGQPRIITASDTISVSYQSLGYLNQGPGQTYGLRAEVPLLDERLIVGLTTLQQKRPGSGSLQDTVGYQEDIYNGSGSTGPFDTNFRPIIANGASVVYKGKRQIIDTPLVVLVDGSEQLEGVDYDSYRSIGRVIFRRAVPPTSLVMVRYYYDIRNDKPTGDQSLWGLDAAYRLAKGLNLTLDWATSDGGSESTRGQALSTSVDYARRGLRLLAEYRDVEPTFNYMDTVGFKRREKGLNLGGQWQINDHITLSNRYSDVESDSGLSFGYSGYGGGYDFASGVSTLATSAQATGSTGRSVSSRRNDLSLTVRYDGWPDLSLQRSSMSNAGGITGSSDYTTDAVRLSWSPRGTRLSLRTNYSRSTQSNLRSSSTSSSTLTRVGSNSRQLQAAVTYNPSDALSFAASTAYNTSSAIETVNTSSSHNTQLTARWAPSPKFDVELSRSLSRTDGRVSSGYYSSYPVGTPGTGGGPSLPGGYSPGGSPLPPGGGSGGSGGGTSAVRPSSDDVSDRLSVTFRPSNVLSFDLNAGRRKYKSTGSQGYLADSNQEFWNLGASWLASDALSLNMSLGSDTMQFLDKDRGTVSNNSFIFGVSYRPPEARWSASVNLNLQDGTSPTYAGYGRLQRYRTVSTDLFDINGEFTYDLTDDLTLVGTAGLSDFAGGYADFRKTSAELRMRYRINGSTGLDLGYRFIKNISRHDETSLLLGSTSAGQNYLTNTFLLTLSTNFSGGVGQGDGRFRGSRRPGLGYGSGPGTFGGYQAGLQAGRSSSMIPFGGGVDYYSGRGVGSGFGSGARIGGQAASRFDALTMAQAQQRQLQDYGPFGPDVAWGAGAAGARSGPGTLTAGLGDFRKKEHVEGELPGPAGLEVPPGERTPQSRERKPGRPAEPADWMLLQDGRSYW